MTRESIAKLNDFASWTFQEQSEFGARIFELLQNIYQDIAAMGKDVRGVIEQEDLQVMGRKFSACMEKKSHKVPIIHKPLEGLTKPTLIFKTVEQLWYIHTAGDHPEPIVESPNIVYCIAYAVWNDLFIPTEVRMLPNATSVSLQEIISLGKKIRNFFGISDIAAVPYPKYLEAERIEKALIVVNFDTARGQEDIRDLCLISGNNWGELFVKRWDSLEELKAFLDDSRETSQPMEVHYYVQRNSLLYEKIIERTKRAATKRFLP